jgi:hypothetical protein
MHRIIEDVASHRRSRYSGRFSRRQSPEIRGFLFENGIKRLASLLN